jgi:hypothetical protein
MEATSGGLSSLIARSHEAVDRISEATGRLSQDAETLRFGLDMEQAVSDILADVVAINDEVYGFLRGK